MGVIFSSVFSIKKIPVWQLLCYMVLAVVVLLGTLHIFKGDLFYETDIARDFLIVNDMVVQRKISLIGGRSSLPGVFHGPLYYWMLLPLFVVSGGNPIVMSYLWLVLYWLFLVSFYYVGRKIFDSRFALISTTFAASLTAFYPAGFTHTTVANLLIIPWMYFVHQYAKQNKVGWILAAVFTSGLLIQFQMAFGLPMFILLCCYVVYLISRKRTYLHILALLLIALPLSTFMLFDLRHEFIQIKTVFGYSATNATGSVNGYFHDRWVSMVDSFSVMTSPNKVLRDGTSMLALASLVMLAWKNSRSGKKQNLAIFILTGIVIGFWIVSAPYKGNVWQPYYRPLLPVVVFCVTYFLLKYLPKKAAFLLFAVMIGSNLFFAIKGGIHYWQSNATDDEIHWKFYSQLSKDIVANSNGQQIGYYVFTPDQYGYQAKYAMNYFASSNEVRMTPYKKQSITYLIFAPTNPNNPWANPDDWQANKVKINREADQLWSYPNGYSVHRYDLTQEEKSVASDPNLVDGIQTR